MRQACVQHAIAKFVGLRLLLAATKHIPHTTLLSLNGLEQILDATSNEPWGPHGSLLAEIAQATNN
jgi:hypothetical protein